MKKAKSSRSNENENQGPEVTPEIGISLIRRQIDEANGLMANRPIDEQKYYSWHDATQTYLNKAFGKNVKYLGSGVGISLGYGVSEHERQRIREKEHFDSLKDHVINLEGFIKQLQTEIEISGLSDQKVSSKDSVQPKEIKTQVFIVHGRNDDVKNKVARFLEKAGLSAIILHEQPGKGRTLIEKFLDHSLVGYAVVLLTADDLGKGKEEAELKARARQNVVFELGYFLALLGRDRVSVLCEEGIEVPSDYSGVEYLPLNKNGVWQTKLLTELSSAGFNVDFETAVRVI